MSSFKKDSLPRTKAAVFDRLTALRTRGRTQISKGNRNKIDPYALKWVEGPVPSKMTDMDTLRGICWTLERGVPKIVDNPETVLRLQSQVRSQLSHAQDLWSRGDGRLLPRKAIDAAQSIKSGDLPTEVTELQGLIKDLGGTL